MSRRLYDEPEKYKTERFDRDDVNTIPTTANSPFGALLQSRFGNQLGRQLCSIVNVQLHKNGL